MSGDKGSTVAAVFPIVTIYGKESLQAVTATLSFAVYADGETEQGYTWTSVVTPPTLSPFEISSVFNIATLSDNAKSTVTFSATSTPQLTESSTLSHISTIPSSSKPLTAITSKISMSSLTIAPDLPSPTTAKSTISASPKTSASASAVSASKKGFSKGATAGIAIACFLIGVSVAALVFWLLISRRRRRGSINASTMASPSKNSSNGRHKYMPMISISKHTKETPQDTRHQDQDPEHVLSPLSPDQTNGTPLPPSSFTIKRKRISTALTSGLAPGSVNTSASHFSDLRTQVNTLFEQLEMHVDNFYSSESGALALTEDQQHALQQVDSPYIPDSIIGLLPEAQGYAVKALIKHCLAYAVFSRIDGNSSDINPEDALLPTGLLTLMQAVVPASSISEEMDRCRQWKHDTVAMMGTSSMKSEEIQAKINHLAWTCVRAFEPWAVQIYGKEARKSHLTRVVGEVAEIGFRMFGEKHGWLVWQWEANAVASEGRAADQSLVVFPGLELRKELGRGRESVGGRAMNTGEEGAPRSEVILAPTVANIGA